MGKSRVWCTECGHGHLCVVPGLATDRETWSRHHTSHSKRQLGLAMELMFQIEISNISQFITVKHMFEVSYISA